MTEEKSEAHLVTVADGVHAWIGAGGDSNAGAIETPEGVIVIDTQQYPRLTPIARRGARQDRQADARGCMRNDRVVQLTNSRTGIHSGPGRSNPDGTLPIEG
jgi:hypothetical protein